MCGIVGYIGKKNAATVIVCGLKRLEYRGYDSSGVALQCSPLTIIKQKGKISELEKALDYSLYNDCHAGIGHTRWATHGVPSNENSHPHVSCDGKIAIVHNGIIENYALLKSQLEKKGHHFKSETDTEVIAHLIEHYYTGNILEATFSAIQKLEGAYGIAVVSSSDPERIIAARKGSPLVVGIGEDEIIVASDCSAIIEYTRQVIYLNDGEVIDITRNGFATYDINKQSIEKEITLIHWDIASIEKGGFDHFMLKEIFEQGETISNAFRGRLLNDLAIPRLDGLNLTPADIRSIKRIIFIACGTSWHAGLIGKYVIEEYARIPVEVEYASEFRYKSPILQEGDLVISISQSGETADTLAGMREAKSRGVKTLALTNVVGSTIARESSGGLYLHAGPEVGVASTKAFTSQVMVLVLIAIYFARHKEMSFEEGSRILREIEELPEKINEILGLIDSLKIIARTYKNADNFLYLGRGINFPVALEGALKLKEISYIHAEGYPAAEMKHGPIALIDENMPVVIIAIRDSIFNKILSNIQEVKARKGKTIIIATEGDEEIAAFADHIFYVPKTDTMLSPILTVVPLQLLSYLIATERGCDVDKPRNLAKSVTVE